MIYTCRYCGQTFDNLTAKNAHEADHLRGDRKAARKAEKCLLKRQQEAIDKISNEFDTLTKLLDDYISEYDVPKLLNEVFGKDTKIIWNFLFS